jgi:endonuclease YncB( thermonuclease family)
MATAEVIRVVDGDTFHAFLDIGWGIILMPRGKAGAFGTVRVTYPDGVKWDAAEGSTERGREARRILQALLPVGIKLEVVSHEIDVFGRTLGSVTLPNGEDWATAMHTMGFTK